MQKILSILILTMKKVIGKMKNKSKGKINDKFVGLKSKVHSIKKCWW